MIYSTRHNKSSKSIKEAAITATIDYSQFTAGKLAMPPVNLASYSTAGSIQPNTGVDYNQTYTVSFPEAASSTIPAGFGFGTLITRKTMLKSLGIDDTKIASNLQAENALEEQVGVLTPQNCSRFFLQSPISQYYYDVVPESNEPFSWTISNSAS